MFFDPLRFQLEAANLFEELRLMCGLLVLLTGMLLTKQLASTIKELMFPLGNLGRMNLIGTH
jgi:hypothetical protein